MPPISVTSGKMMGTLGDMLTQLQQNGDKEAEKMSRFFVQTASDFTEDRAEQVKKLKAWAAAAIVKGVGHLFAENLPKAMEEFEYTTPEIEEVEKVFGLSPSEANAILASFVPAPVTA
jgi:hypothetical protein